MVADLAGSPQVTKDLVGVRSGAKGNVRCAQLALVMRGHPTQPRGGYTRGKRPEGASPTPVFHPMEDFLRKQSQDDTLHFAFDQVRLTDGQPVRPDPAPSHPFFLLLEIGYTGSVRSLRHEKR